MKINIATTRGLNPRPFSVFRHLRQWRGGGDGATPHGVWKLGVVELSGKDHRIAFDEYSRLVVRFFDPRSKIDSVLGGQRSNFHEMGNFST